MPGMPSSEAEVPEPGRGLRTKEYLDQPSRRVNVQVGVRGLGRSPSREDCVPIMAVSLARLFSSQGSVPCMAGL